MGRISESPVSGNADTVCAPNDVERLPCKDGSWEEFKERFREEENSSEWTLGKIREAHENIAKDEIGRLGIVQENLRKSTDFLRRVIASVGGMGGVTLSYIDVTL